MFLDIVRIEVLAEYPQHLPAAVGVAPAAQRGQRRGQDAAGVGDDRLVGVERRAPPRRACPAAAGR